MAVLIRQRSLVDDGWLAERLATRSRTAVSRIMREARENLKSNRKAKALGRRLEKQIDQIWKTDINSICLTPSPSRKQFD